MSILGRANRRHFLRHPLQLLLAILGVALGVAMVVSIDLAAESTHRAFALSMQALTGRYTHHLTGGPSGLPESLFTRLRVEAGIRESAPAIEGYVTANDITLRLAGFDPFSERNLRSRFVKAAKGDDAVRLLTEPDTVMISALTAQHLRVQPGKTLDITVNGKAHTVNVLAFIEGDGSPDPSLEGLMIADIATAQELLGRLGVLDRIDLILNKCIPGFHNVWKEFSDQSRYKSVFLANSRISYRDWCSSRSCCVVRGSTAKSNRRSGRS